MVQNVSFTVGKELFNKDSVINTMLYSLSVQKDQILATRSYLLQGTYGFDVKIRPYASDLLDKFKDLEYIMCIAEKTNVTKIELGKAKTKLAFIQREIDDELHYKKLKLSQTYKLRLLADGNIKNKLDSAITDRTKDLATLRRVLVPQEDVDNELYEMLRGLASNNQGNKKYENCKTYQPLWTNLRYKRIGKGRLLRIKTELESKLREYTEEASEIDSGYDINKHIINTIGLQLDSKYLTVNQGKKKNGHIIPIQENYGLNRLNNPNIRHHKGTTRIIIQGGTYTILKDFARNLLGYMASFGGRFKH